MAANDLRALVAYRGLLRGLVQRDLTVKYKGSLLGVAWSLLHPLVMVAVYTLAFRYVVRVPIERFPLFLLSGLLPWMFFTSGLARRHQLDRRQRHAGAQGGLPARRAAAGRRGVGAGAVPADVHGARADGAGDGRGLSPAWLALVPVVLLQTAFTAGLGLLLATAYVFVRDARHLLDVALQVWFWLTPIVYAASLAPENLRRWLQLNPMLHFVTAYQDIVTQRTTCRRCRRFALLDRAGRGHRCSSAGRSSAVPRSASRSTCRDGRRHSAVSDRQSAVVQSARAFGSRRIPAYLHSRSARSAGTADRYQRRSRSAQFDGTTARLAR